MNIAVELKKIAAKVRLYTPTTKEILEEAKQILVKKGWTQRSMARDKAGHMISTRDSGAAAFCSLGAIHKATLNFGLDPWRAYRVSGQGIGTAERAERAIEAFITSESSIADWNDSGFRTKAEVLSVFDKAIEAQK